MATFNKFEVLSEHLAEGVHQLQAAGHTLECYLSNTVPSAAGDSVKADLAEITNQNGYAAPADTQNDTSRAGAVTSVVGTDIVLTSTGAGFGPFQYVVLQNTTPTSPLDPLIGWWNYGSAITPAGGETFTINFGTSMFTVT